MVNTLKIWSFVIVLICMGIGSASAALIDDGDLTTIDDPGNPSDGLQYLDMSYSEGLTLADALNNAQATYPNARLATPSEWNHLFAAAGINYDGALTASNAFSAGNTAFIASGANYNTSIRDLLGITTAPDQTFIFSDPDGSNDPTTTRDTLLLSGLFAGIFNENATPPNANVGWLLVTETTTIEVAVDIKPYRCPNFLNVKFKQGVLWVSILGTDDFNVFTIDPASIRLAGVAPIRSWYGDVTTPPDTLNGCDCTIEGRDGFRDLSLFFKRSEIIDQLGAVNHGDEIALTLTGVTDDGNQIEGSDCLKIIEWGWEL